jgi:hypothetical protein
MLRVCKLITAAIVLAALPLGAQASWISYAFTVTATDGPSTGDVASGTFSFDSTLLDVPNASLQQAGLLTALDFTWNGQAFDATSANTGNIITGAAAGQLALVLFGDDCSPACGVSAAQPNDWLVGYDFLDGYGVFVYGGTFVSRDVTFTLLPTPLPPSALLLLSAVGLLGALRYRTAT